MSRYAEIEKACTVTGATAPQSGGDSKLKLTGELDAKVWLGSLPRRSEGALKTDYPSADHRGLQHARCKVSNGTLRRGPRSARVVPQMLFLVLPVAPCQCGRCLEMNQVFEFTCSDAND
jgi:hypothetical protein